jgi:3-oxoacyl-[acyl-carrier protein] reductase
VDLGIRGKVAVVSGASKGIGRSVASILAREGARVVMSARRADILEAAAGAIRDETGAEVVAVAADMTTEAGVTAVLDAAGSLGPVQIAVSNVDGPKALGFEATPDEAFYDAYRCMVMSAVWLVRGVIPAMKRLRWGRIVNIGSDCAIEVHREVPLVLANVTRPAALGLHKTLADELAPFGITVNMIAVGGTLTENRITFMDRFAAEHHTTIEEVATANTRHIPLGRFGTPDEVAAAAVFLCSEPAGFVTGEIVAVDGGRTRTLL